MGRIVGIGWLLTGVVLAAGACAHDPEGAPPRGTAVGTSPLAPFDSVDLPHPNSREQLAAALRTRGFLAANAPEGTQLGGAIRAFQKSEGLPQTGYPDDETLRQLGIDPRTKDRTLDPAPVWREGTTGAGVSH
ncbi:MAG: peptidoglycan-binding protein [Myxococcaceae bacterium]|nr:MAG: peptidoglycan-binding protein [Myxococcaceae bacterium]